MVDGQVVELLAGASGLVWTTRQAGTYSMALVWRTGSASSGASADGAALAVPLPQAASIRLRATLPGIGLGATVIPAQGVQIEEVGGTTRLTAVVPSSSGAQIAWRPASRAGHALSRAVYRGSLNGDAVAWIGELEVESWQDAPATIALLPKSATLANLQVDGRDAPILVEGDRFAVRLPGSGGAGRGRHVVRISFETPVAQGDGPPGTVLEMPPVPVSRLELILPGQKDLRLEPAANVRATRRGAETVAVAHLPMAGRVALSWTEAVPEDVRAEARSNATFFHVVHAEEGVLFVRALVDWEVTRGETHVLRLAVPPGVQVNRVASSSGAVADWRVGDGEPGKPVELTVFLDRKLEGRLLLEVDYDRSLPVVEIDPAAPQGEAPELELPLLEAIDVHRQRGMAVLLQGRELALRPLDDGGATRVGENQLPVFVREKLAEPVAHTFKYAETPTLRVAVTEPERREARFDARVDTLVSLGEVSLKATATIELDIKAGRLLGLSLDLPAAANLLGLTGPSLRDAEPATSASADGGARRLELQFTQEMEGQVRLEAVYELLLDEDGNAPVEVPLLTVVGAEVEQGRLAVEARTAVEVGVGESEGLSLLDAADLPRALVLRTTHPILLARQYVRAERPVRLALEITRHDLLAVEQAAIDRAHYRTLFTRDGLAMTTARFEVRNSGEQFLRLDLPGDAEVLSVFVDGRPEKPALATADGAGDPRRKTILIKIVHSTDGFPVELVYRRPSAPIGGFAETVVRAELPRPDILVTETLWEVDLPRGVRYLAPRSNLEQVGGTPTVGGMEGAAKIDAAAQRLAEVLEPLHLTVPESGIRFTFTKLYANQAAGEPAWIEIPYVSPVGERLGHGLGGGGAALLWLGVALGWMRLGRADDDDRRRFAAGPRLGAALVALGLGALLVALGRYHAGVGAALWVSGIAMLGIVAVWWRSRSI